MAVKLRNINIRAWTNTLFVLTCAYFTASLSPKTEPFFGIKTVVIDAGHGGKDPGCLGPTHKEKDVALAIALKLGHYIEKYMNDVKVVYTRKTDVFLELNERAAIANKNKADLFICIHCNSACYRDKKTRKEYCKEETHGSETYVMGLHKTDANRNVAMRENSSILMEKDYKKKYDGFDPESDEGFILITMQQNAYLKQSIAFASKIQKHLKEKAGREDKGVQQAGFLVLWKTAMPSVLIETGFLTNPKEEKFLASEKGQDYIGLSIFRAFRDYKNEVEGRIVKYDDEVENIPPYVPDQTDSLPIVSPKDTAAKSPEIAPQKKDPIRSAADSVKQVKKDEEKPKENPGHTETTVKNGVLYKVQFTSSDKILPADSPRFKDLEKVSWYQDKGIYKYTAGEFKTMEEAFKYQKQLNKKGFRDAFVVSFRDGKRIK